MLDLLDIEPLATVQGKSMEPVFSEKNHPGNDYVFAEFLEDNKAMVSDGKWKYVFTTGAYDLGQGYQTGLGPSGILHKLYDLDNDPEESMNISWLPCNQTILTSLQQKMVEIFTDTYPEDHIFNDSIGTEDKLIWFCEPRDEGASRGIR